MFHAALFGIFLVVSEFFVSCLWPLVGLLKTVRLSCGGSPSWAGGLGAARGPALQTSCDLEFGSSACSEFWLFLSSGTFCG